MIYLDYNASTPVAPEVCDAMLPYLGEVYGNPSSAHALGVRMAQAVGKARKQVANLFGATSDEIVFTSGGTESNNYVIKGVAHSLAKRGNHIITSAVEHPAVINPCKFLERQGIEVSYVPVDGMCTIDPQSVIDEIRPTTILVSIMHANNEVGTVQNIAEIAAIAREAGILMHTDAAQTCGKESVNVGELGVDFLSLAGHKVYAPAGVGALYIRKGIDIESLHHGAGHESGRRAGTEPVANMIGLGQACELALHHLGDKKIRSLRDRMFDGLTTQLGDGVVLLGHPEKRLNNTLAVGFPGKIGSDILSAASGVCASTGAACHSGKHIRSATLSAMKVPDKVAFGAIRFSVGTPTTEQEIDDAVDLIVRAMRQ